MRRTGRRRARRISEPATWGIAYPIGDDALVQRELPTLDSIILKIYRKIRFMTQRKRIVYSHFWGRFWARDEHHCMGRHRRGPGFGAFAAAFGEGMGGRGFVAGRKLAAGDLQLLILALLERNPRHGYEIIKALGEYSGGFYAPSPGMVYPALTYLEELGFATVEA